LENTSKYQMHKRIWQEELNSLEIVEINLKIIDRSVVFYAYICSTLYLNRHQKVILRHMRRNYLELHLIED